MVVLLSWYVFAEDSNELQGQKFAQDQNIGTSIGSSLKNEDVLASKGIYFDKSAGSNTLTFEEEGSYIKVKKNLFMNIKKKDKDTDAYVKLDGKAEVVEADFTTNANSVYVIGNDKIDLPPNSRVVFKDGKVSVFIPEGSKLNKAPGLVDLKKPGSTIEINSKNMVLPEGNVLYDGIITYKSGKPYVLKGAYAVIDNYRLTSTDEDVELKFGKRSLFSVGGEPGNFVRFSDKVEVSGTGFKVDLYSEKGVNSESAKQLFLKLPKRGYYKNGDHPVDSSEKDSVETIQNVVGATVDGKYGPATAAKVKDWQDKVYKEKGVCLGKLTGSVCTPDGFFGEQSAKFLLEGGSKNAPLISVSPHNGRAELGLSPSGFNANFDGSFDMVLGNKKLHFKTEEMDEELVKSNVKSLFSTGLSLPTNLYFFSGDQRIVNIKTYGTDTFFSKDLTESQLPSILAKKGINQNEVTCAGAVCSIFKEQGPEGIRYGGVLNPTLSGAAGVEGNAWEMSKNMQAKGGKLVYFKEASLSGEDKETLNSLKQEILSRYSKDLSDSDKVELVKKLSGEIRVSEGDILGKEVFSDNLALDSGDVVGMYYKKSNYLAQALAEGKGEDLTHKNTHVGVIKSFKENTIDVSKASDPITFMKNKLGLKNDDSLYVNEYYVKLKGSDHFEQVRLSHPSDLGGNKFYTSDSEVDLKDMGQVMVRRPEVAHMIHYGQEKNPYHIEFLDKTIDQEDISLYSVTRPKEDLKDKIAQAKFAQIDSLTVTDNKGVCETPECKLFGSAERARFNGVDKKVTDFLDNKLSSNIPSYQEEQFKAAMLTAIQMESGGIKYYGNLIENQISKIVEIKDRSVGTYTQIKPSTLDEAAKITGKDIKGIDLNTDEGSLKATEIVMEAIFTKYVPKDKKKLTDEDIEVIGAAWNAGITSEYAQKLSKKQYASLPKIKAQSTKGKISEYYAKILGYDTNGYFNAVPTRFKGSFKTYCCSS